MTTLNEQIEVMQAFGRGEAIEYTCPEVHLKGIWYHATTPIWNWECYDYRVWEPLKKTEKVKFLGYMTSAGVLAHCKEGYESGGWKRIPSEDKILEVEL